MINKRFLMALAVAPLIEASAQQGVYADRRPNIVLFMVDDMGWQDTSLPFWVEKTPLNRRYHTPNMERLASEGMKFTQAYACSVSSPSRVSLMSGMNAARHRVTNWTLEKNTSTDRKSPVLDFPAWNVNGICQVDNIPYTYCITSLPQLLKDAGYHTIHCGKAHWGAVDTPGENPHHFGFEVNIAGHAGGGVASYLGTNNFGNRTDGKPSSLQAVPGLKEYWGNEGPGIGPTCTIRSGDWKLIYYYQTGEKELFNIRNDIGEKQNLAAQHPSIVKKLLKDLGQYLRKVKAQRPTFKSTGKSYL